MVAAILRSRIGALLLAVVVLVVVAAAALLAFGDSGSGDDELVVYNGRSQYGDESVFREFERASDTTLVLRGGTAPELFERLRSEGEDTPADLLVTTDLANLWRAKEAGLLEPAGSDTLSEQVPDAYRDPDREWWGVSLRLRTPVRSVARVPADAVTSYESLGDPRWKGRLCLRTSNNEYNQSLVADLIAKRGPERTEALLRSWMANDPDVLGSDVDVLEAIEAGSCDVGLTNHYYLGRMLADDPDFPVAPAWPDQDGAGVHGNLSGVGLVRGTDGAGRGVALMEHLTSAAGQAKIVANSELATNPEVPPPPHIAEWADVKVDPIDVAEAGALLPDAVAMMQRVGWR